MNIYKKKQVELTAHAMSILYELLNALKALLIQKPSDINEVIISPLVPFWTRSKLLLLVNIRSFQCKSEILNVGRKNISYSGNCIIVFEVSWKS